MNTQSYPEQAALPSLALAPKIKNEGIQRQFEIDLSRSKKNNLVKYFSSLVLSNKWYDIIKFTLNFEKNKFHQHLPGNYEEIHSFTVHRVTQTTKNSCKVTIPFTQITCDIKYSSEKKIITISIVHSIFQQVRTMKLNFSQRELQLNLEVIT